jgi:hypothetical protein
LVFSRCADRGQPWQALKITEDPNKKSTLFGGSADFGSDKHSLGGGNGLYANENPAIFGGAYTCPIPSPSSEICHMRQVLKQGHHVHLIMVTDALVLQIACGLSLLYVVCSLSIRTSAEKLYYLGDWESRSRFFSSLNYNDERVLEVLPSLLSAEGYYLDKDYGRAKIGLANSIALFEHFFPWEELHPLVLPFGLVSSCYHLFIQVSSSLDRYKPGVISLKGHRTNYFGEEHMRQILRTLILNPVFCGSTLTFLRAQSLGYTDSWRINPRALDQSAEPPKFCILEVVEGMYNDFLENRAVRVINPRPECYDAKFISDYFREILYTKNWFNFHEKVQSHIRQITFKLDASRRALWHAKFLLLTFGPLDRRGDVNKPTPKILDFLVSVVKNFLMEHDPRDVPPFLRGQILRCIVMCGVAIPVRTPNHRLEDAMRLFRKLHPYQRVLVPDISTAIEIWQYVMHNAGSHLLQIPTEPQDFDNVVDWWGSYKDLGKVLLVDPELPIPITFMESGAQNTKCITIQCLLANITRMLSSGRAQRDDECLWKALARTIASNFLYLGELGFGTHALPLEWFKRQTSRRASSGTKVIKQQLVKCGLMSVFQFADNRVFLPKPRDPDRATFVETAANWALVFTFFLSSSLESHFDSLLH